MFILHHHCAVDLMDYESVDIVLMFDSCEKRRCVDVVIVDDILLEDTELFDVTLERPPELDNRITLTPIDGEIEIIDDDGMIHHFQRNGFYSSYIQRLW